MTLISTMVGSYPKVAEQTYSTKLIGAIAQRQRHELTEAGLEQVFRDITRAVIREQEQAGLDLLTDGQIRWEDLVTPIARRLDGFEINGLSRWYNNNTYYRRPVLQSAPRWRGPILVEEYRFAAGCTRRPVKAILPGPSTFARMSEDRHFKRAEAFVLAMAEILNAEARALAKAGAPVIQFDEPSLGFGATDMTLAVKALNVATEGVEATTAVSTYFGSLNGALGALMRARVDVIGLDVVSDPKTLALLRRVKATQGIALGCVDARNTKLESVTELHALFDVARRLVPEGLLHITPNCGLEFLPHPQARAKLHRVAEAVRTYTGAR